VSAKEKYCRECRERKPIAEFHHGGELRMWCRQCAQDIAEYQAAYEQ
jgi:hypothetical protein